MRATWFIRPRDPIVVRDGKVTTELGAKAPYPLPLPGTVAGMARAWFVRGESYVSRDRARELLKTIRVAGPWLTQAHETEDGVAMHFEPWVCMSADAVMLPGDGSEIDGYGRLVPVDRRGAAAQEAVSASAAPQGTTEMASVTYDRGRRQLRAKLAAGKDAEASGARAAELLEALPEAERRQLQGGKAVRLLVTWEPNGNARGLMKLQAART